MKIAIASKYFNPGCCKIFQKSLGTFFHAHLQTYTQIKADRQTYPFSFYPTKCLLAHFYLATNVIRFSTLLPEGLQKNE